VVDLGTGLFDCSYARFNGLPLTLPLSVPIATSSVVITNLTNLLSIPQTLPSSGLTVYSLDSSSSKVAQSSFSSGSLISNTPATGLSYTFTRSSTAIGGAGSLTVSYTPRFLTVAASLTIYFPSNQMKMISSACQMQTASLVPCQILSSNATVITVAFLNQTKTILTDVSNVEPNGNLLRIESYNGQGELVERTDAAITPAIQLNSLAVTGSSTSTSVAFNTVLTLSISSGSPVSPTSKLVIDFPSESYTRIPALVTSDCSYTIGANSYSGCQFLSSSGWLTEMNISNLGVSTVLANTSITVRIPVTNGWTSKSFGSGQIMVYVCSADNSYLSMGTLPLTTLNGVSNFVAAAVGGLMLN
jgi:hypothetical protein